MKANVVEEKPGIDVTVPEPQKDDPANLDVERISPVRDLAGEAGLFVSRVADFAFIPVRDIAFSYGNTDHRPGKRLVNAAWKVAFNGPAIATSGLAAANGAYGVAAAFWAAAIFIPVARQAVLTDCTRQDASGDADDDASEEHTRQKRYWHAMLSSPRTTRLAERSRELDRQWEEAKKRKAAAASHSPV